MTVFIAAILIAAFVCGIRVIQWFFEGDVKPDPWDEETETELHSENAVFVCHRCFTPQTEAGWFCPKCGSSVGPYNNWMPYLHIFAVGEVLRTGADQKYRKTPLTFFGYLIFSFTEYFVFAPIYWYRFLRNYKRDGSSRVEESDPITN